MEAVSPNTSELNSLEKAYTIKANIYTHTYYTIKVILHYYYYYTIIHY